MNAEQRRKLYRYYWKQSGLTLKEIGQLVDAAESTAKQWSAGIRNIPTAKLELIEIRLKEKKLI